MVGSAHDRRMRPEQQDLDEATYDNQTLFEDMPEYTEEMAESTFMDSDINGNEINVWSDGEETGTAETAIRYLEGDYHQPFGDEFDAAGEPIPGASNISAEEQDIGYRSGLDQEFYDQLGTEFHSTGSDPLEPESRERNRVMADGGRRIEGYEVTFNPGNNSEIPWKNPGEPSNDEF